MSPSSGHVLSRVVVLDAAPASEVDAQQGKLSAERALDDLERELRVAKDERARAIDEQRRLRDAAEAARRFSIDEAEARVLSEAALIKASARIAELEAGLRAAVQGRVEAEAALTKASAHAAELEAVLVSAITPEQGSLAFETIRYLRNLKDGLLLPPETVRRALYDWALPRLKRRLGLRTTE